MFRVLIALAALALCAADAEARCGGGRLFHRSRSVSVQKAAPAPKAAPAASGCANGQCGKSVQRTRTFSLIRGR